MTVYIPGVPLRRRFQRPCIRWNSTAFGTPFRNISGHASARWRGTRCTFWPARIWTGDCRTGTRARTGTKLNETKRNGGGNATTFYFLRTVCFGEFEWASLFADETFNVRGYFHSNLLYTACQVVTRGHQQSSFVVSCFTPRRDSFAKQYQYP